MSLPGEFPVVSEHYQRGFGVLGFVMPGLSVVVPR
jgi:hypothetical protein